MFFFVCINQNGPRGMVPGMLYNSMKRQNKEREKISLALSRHSFIVLLKELKVSLLNPLEGSTFYRHTAAGRNYRLNLSILQIGITKAKLPRAAVWGTDFPHVPQTRKKSSHSLSVLQTALYSKPE